MQEVYRINTIAGYKPWRSGGPYFITDKPTFDLLVEASETGDDFYRIPAPGAEVDEDGYLIDEDKNIGEWLYSEDNTLQDLKPPYILLDEVTFYTE